MKRTRIFCIWMAIILTSTLYGQNEDLKFRFGNVKYDVDAASMRADIEYRSSTAGSAVCAMNARFFYEDEYLEFESFSDFQEGYDFVSEPPVPLIGGDESAENMFESTGKAVYINAGIELKYPVEIKDKGNWRRLVRVNFRMKEAAFNLRHFCPSIIWDKSNSDEKSSFLKGSVGVAASLLTVDAEGNIDCNFGTTSYFNLNWKLKSDEAPFGKPIGGNCNNKRAIIPKNFEVADYSVKQNTPNPFSKETIISIETPVASEVLLNIYNLTGQLLIQQKEYVDKGKFEFLVDDDSLAEGAYMYQVIIDDYKSNYFRMIKVGK